MGARTLTVATRGSRLAVTQTGEALDALRAALPGAFEFRVVPVSSPGDRDLTTPLTDPSVPEDFFTRDIDEMMRRGECDLAVHSAKDLPKTTVPGITVAAHLPALDIREAIVLRRGLTDLAAVRSVGTSSPRRNDITTSMFPRAERKPLRGTIDQRIERLDAGDFDAIIVAACALVRLGLADRIHSYLPADPAPLQGRLAFTVRSDATNLIAQLRTVDVRRKAGLVALLGCPADPALIAARTLTYLERADVIFHDRLIPTELLRLAGDRAVSVGKTGGGPSTPQAEIHRLMLHEAEKGKLVVRLHGGDPGIYGHLGEELEFLTEWGFRVDIVPALTAAQVASADARSPLTHRGRGHRVTLLSAKPMPGVALPNVPGPDLGNLAIYMGVAAWSELETKLREAGWQDAVPIVVGEKLGERDERIRYATLGSMKALDLETPAVFLVGTRAFPDAQATLFVGTDPEHFLKHGPLIHMPLIELASRPMQERKVRLAEHLPHVSGVLFPSRFAVASFMEALMDGGDARSLAGKTLLAVGPSTEKELALHGLRADGAADNLGGVQALALKLTRDFKGRYLYPCSTASPQKERVASLKSHGIDLVPAVFYENREVSHASLPRRSFTRVLFTSTTTVQAYFRQFPAEKQAKRTWIAVGPSTHRALEQLGLTAETIEEGQLPPARHEML